MKSDIYEIRFLNLLSKLNKHRKNDKKYHEITEKMCALVGEMIAVIDFS